jgi:hypothetical protein
MPCAQNLANNFRAPKVTFDRPGASKNKGKGNFLEKPPVVPEITARKI